MSDTIIIGAGLAGALAGALTPNATLFEAGMANSISHNALLRFRTGKIGDALNIPFKAVTVRKGVVEGNHVYTESGLRQINQYSKKVIGRLTDRSIANLEPCTRFIAPEDFHRQLLDRCHGRVVFDHVVMSITAELFDGDVVRNGPIISTVPMPVLQRMTGHITEHEFKHAPIFVERYRVESSEAHQTLYFPAPDMGIYRASLTGPLLIIEAVKAPTHEEVTHVLEMFGLSWADAIGMNSSHQRYGKILPIHDAERKKALLDFTLRFNIFSLGRFACWRNILLDDVYEDLFKIRSMMGLNFYDTMRSIA